MSILKVAACCLQQAAEAEIQAAQIADQHLKAIYLRIAHQWSVLARSYEFADSAERPPTLSTPGPSIRYALIEFLENDSQVFPGRRRSLPVLRRSPVLHVRSRHDCKRWYVRPTIDYLVD